MEPIAIIGVSCLFPGAETPEEYWQNLLSKKDSTSEASVAQMGVDPKIFYDPAKGQTDKYYCMRGGYIRNFQFDGRGYNLPSQFLANPNHLNELDRLFQWSLTVAKDALEDSGYLVSACSKSDPISGAETLLSKCGVILGNLSFPTKSSRQLIAPIYQKTLESTLQKLLQRKDFELESLSSSGEISPLNAMISGYPAALIAQALSLGGMNLSLDAACASSLYAVKVACQQLLSGKADLMLAGAVSAADPLFIHMGFSIFQAYPNNGLSRPFDQSAQGLISGEGAGMFVLKRYADAIRDDDKIYAVIRGIGLSNDGKGKFLLSPYSKGQLLAFERAYAEGDIDPKSIDYVECHATGTSLGDKTELSTMDTFFGQQGAAPLIGSVKSNFGHLLTAAGVAGMLKAIFAMSKGMIPPTINLKNPISSPNQVITANQIVTESIPWPEKEVKRAGVSAFGFGGANAHMILEGGKSEERSPRHSGQPAHREKVQDGSPSPSLTPDAKPLASDGAPPLAIIGMDAFFGSCKDLDAFKQTIYDGSQLFIPLPPNRWKGIEDQPAVLQEYGLESAPLGAYIKDFELDFLHFRIPPHDADQPIAQQLLILKVAERALRDAGLSEGANVAVLIAMGTELALHQFRGRCDLSWQIKESLAKQNIALTPNQMSELEAIAKEGMHNPAQVHQYTSFIGNIMASRISAKWNFSGPAFTISAEENSVFKALEVAQLLLADNAPEGHDKLDAVLVGAVDLAGGVENVLLRHQLAPVNHGTQTLSYDRHANGWLVGEGAGAVVLKKATTAQEAHDRIYATIEAISFVHDNACRGVPSQSLRGGLNPPSNASLPWSPSSDAIRRVCRQAFEQAGIEPHDIGYLELFGSGVSEQDEAEIKGLTLAYQTNLNLTTAVGSVKANIGHTYAASGMASLIKTALTLYQRYIPATPSWSGPKMPEIWSNSPFYVAPESRPWFSASDSKRLAAINGLGLDGATVHLILSEADHEREQRYLQHSAPYLFPLTANTQAALLAQLNRLQQEIEQADSLFRVARHCWQSYEPQATYALAIVAHNSGPDGKKEVMQEIGRARQGLAKAFEQEKAWKTPRGSYFTPNPLGKKGQIAFVYPGAFNSYIDLGRDIFHLFPNLYDELARLLPNMDQLIGEKRLYPRSLERLSEAQLKELSAQLKADSSTIFKSGICFSWLTTKIMRDYFQVQPDAAFGYSMGENGMMFALDIWPVDDHSAVLDETPLFKTRLAGPKNAVREYWGLAPSEIEGASEHEEIWAVYLLKAAPARVREALSTQERVYLTHINTPKEVVVAGDPDACQQLIKSLKCKSLRAPYSQVLHNEAMRSEYEHFVKISRFPIKEETPAGRPNLYFAADEDHTPLNSDSVADHIATGVCQTLDFPRLVQRVYEDGARLFIELGALNTCSRWISRTLEDKEHVALSINYANKKDGTALINLLASLFSHRVPLDLSPLYGPSQESPSRPAQKSLIKRITVGGPPIAATILDKAKTLPSNDFSRSSNQPPRNHPSLHRTNDPSPHRSNDVRLQIANAQVSVLGKNFTGSAPSSAENNADVSVSAKPGLVDRTANRSNDLTISKNRSNELAISKNRSNDFTRSANALPAKQLTELVSLMTKTHASFLRARHQSSQQISQSTRLQLTLSQQMLNLPLQAPHPNRPNPAGEASVQTLIQSHKLTDQTSGPQADEHEHEHKHQASNHHHIVPDRRSKPANVVWDEADLLEFATGKISRVFGPEYAIIESYRRQVRLPMPPYLLVSRVTDIQAERGRFEPSTMQTEYDIPFDAWYAVDGQIPAAIAIESGQCDLLLISYLGVDFENKGELVYRLLDCTLTFLDQLPKEGQTLRYDISINSFARSGDNLLFFFSYECFVGQQMVLKMEGGCAGFFSDEQLEQGKGVMITSQELAQRRNINKAHFTPLLSCHKTAFNENDLFYLSQGHIAACFGRHYDQKGLNRSLRFPAPAMLMIDRVISIEPKGGAWGLGLVIAEKSLAPDDWYFPCHFKDDEVLAGSLIGEGCAQLLQFYLLYLGVQTRTEDARFQPIIGLRQVVRCRGQTTPKDKRLTYRMEVSEIGLTPTPYAKANVQVIMDDKIVVDFQELGWQLSEKKAKTQVASHSSISRLGAHGASRGGQAPSIAPTRPPLFDNWQITEFAIGSIAACFGPEFKRYDERHCSRIPNGDLQLISKVLEIDGQRHDFKSGASILSEYEVSSAPWFCQQNSNPLTTPYSIYMELALQPCGFLSAYMGATMKRPDIDLYFRNLNGQGVIVKEIDLRGKIITNRSRLLSTTIFNDTILQTFEFEFLCEGDAIYRGTTDFGYFTADALVNQVGLDQGQEKRPWYEEADLTGRPTDHIKWPLDVVQPSKPYYKLAHKQLNFLDEALIIANGGQHQQGYIYASKTIDPTDWFYPCHFHGDPVMPGSMGVEAILQAMQLFALRQNLAGHLQSPRFTQVNDHQITWKYRGQIVPSNKKMYLEVHITQIEMTEKQVTIIGDANLWKDGMRIYEVKDAAIRLCEFKIMSRK